MTPMVVRWFGRSVDRYIGGGLGHTHPWPITRVPLPPFTRPFSPSGSAFVFLPPIFFLFLLLCIFISINQNLRFRFKFFLPWAAGQEAAGGESSIN